MKKAILFFLIFLPITASAKTLKYVELGINQSRFRNQECKSKIGPSFGLGLDYYPIKNFGAFIGTELLYQNKKLLVEDKTWPNDIHPESANWYTTGNFHINISYIEIPLQIGYSIKLNKQFTSHIFTGCSLSIPMKDHTRTKNRIPRELTPNERGTINFDYILVDESGVSMSNNFNIGLRLSCNRFALSLLYTRALSVTENMEGKSIQGKIDSFGISFACIV